MALFAQATDQTDKDFDGLRLKLQSLVRSVFADWTDLHGANFGNLLLPGQSGARPVSRPRPSEHQDRSSSMPVVRRCEIG
jgi:hypothetical protein